MGWGVWVDFVQRNTTRAHAPTKYLHTRAPPQHDMAAASFHAVTAYDKLRRLRLVPTLCADGGIHAHPHPHTHPSLPWILSRPLQLSRNRQSTWKRAPEPACALSCVGEERIDGFCDARLPADADASPARGLHDVVGAW